MLWTSNSLTHWLIVLFPYTIQETQPPGQVFTDCQLEKFPWFLSGWLPCDAASFCFQVPSSIVSLPFLSLPRFFLCCLFLRFFLYSFLCFFMFSLLPLFDVYIYIYVLSSCYSWSPCPLTWLSGDRLGAHLFEDVTVGQFISWHFTSTCHYSWFSVPTLPEFESVPLLTLIYFHEDNKMHPPQKPTSISQNL